MTENHKNYFKDLYQGAERTIFENANSLRKNETITEKILWECLRKKKLNGYKFRRQHPIDKYVADFYCPEKKLVVELDGVMHKGKEKDDKERTEDLKLDGIHVLRFRNKMVLENLEKVLAKILYELERR